jgi:uncharacterized protein YjiS (DUF1127 family)
MSNHLKTQTQSRFPIRYGIAAKLEYLRPIFALSRCWSRRKAIAELQRLDDRLLADIGISRGQIPQVVDGLGRPQARMTRSKPSVSPGEWQGEHFRMAA